MLSTRLKVAIANMNKEKKKKKEITWDCVSPQIWEAVRMEQNVLYKWLKYMLINCMMTECCIVMYNVCV